MTSKCHECKKPAQYYVRYVHIDKKSFFSCGDCLPVCQVIELREIEFCPHCAKQISPPEQKVVK